MRPVLAEIAGLVQSAPELQHQVLGGPIGSMNVVRAMRPVSPVDPIQTTAARTAQPALDGGEADTTPTRHRPLRVTSSN
jgi:hypothetical protein